MITLPYGMAGLNGPEDNSQMEKTQGMYSVNSEQSLWPTFLLLATSQDHVKLFRKVPGNIPAQNTRASEDYWPH